MPFLGRPLSTWTRSSWGRWAQALWSCLLILTSHLQVTQARAHSVWELETNVPLAWARVSPQFCTALWLNRKDCKSCKWQMGLGSLNYMWLCMHMHTHMHTMHTNTCTPTGTHIQVCVYTCTHAYTYMNTHMHAHTCTLASPAALEAYLPKGTRVDQVKANNPRKKMWCIHNLNILT